MSYHPSRVSQQRSRRLAVWGWSDGRDNLLWRGEVDSEDRLDLRDDWRGAPKPGRGRLRYLREGTTRITVSVLQTFGGSSAGFSELFIGAVPVSEAERDRCLKARIRWVPHYS